jgi:CDP-4-dehydro-6-deoxyglucose reductase, E1
MQKKFRHLLMENNIIKSDIDKVIKFLKRKNQIFTSGKNVKKFEKEWSNWLGVRYSVFVNSGSSANFLSMACLKAMGLKGEIIVPTLTWVSDIVSVLKNDFKPIFVDIDLKNLCMDIDQVISKINKKTVAVFLTHAQGFNGLNEKLLKVLKKRKILLIEDVCESHGAKFKNKKLGNFGIISNFSFYYAHHLSTIEGGMFCTNDKKIYNIARSMRAHGMARELDSPLEEKKMIRKYSDLSPKFIFCYPGYNFRNNEIGAIIGLNQLKRLDKNNKKRSENLELFLKLLDGSKFYKNFDLVGNSNYAFPLIIKNKSLKNRAVLEKKMKLFNIEFRRGNAGGGNQLRQPYLQEFVKNINLNHFQKVDHVHFYGYYIGNYPSLSNLKIKKICKILNSVRFK